MPTKHLYIPTARALRPSPDIGIGASLIQYIYGILYFNRFCLFDGVSLSIGALSAMRARDPDTSFAVIGTDSMKRAVRIEPRAMRTSFHLSLNDLQVVDSIVPPYPRSDPTEYRHEHDAQFGGSHGFDNIISAKSRPSDRRMPRSWVCDEKSFLGEGRTKRVNCQICHSPFV
jgi:hypothetical protein